MVPQCQQAILLYSLRLRYICVAAQGSHLKRPTFSLTVSCHSPEFLIIYQQNSDILHFSAGSANYIASSIPAQITLILFNPSKWLFHKLFSLIPPVSSFSILLQFDGLGILFYNIKIMKREFPPPPITIFNNQPIFEPI